jgi:putative transposase
MKFLKLAIAELEIVLFNYFLLEIMTQKRKHPRLREWDYASPGAYFITICCHKRESCFGKIINHKMTFSEIGIMASQYWLGIPVHFPMVKLDDFVIMPNHIHGIIILDNSLARPRHGVALRNNPVVNVGSCHGMTAAIKSNLNPDRREFSKPVKNSVSVIINQYKSSLKRWCNKNGFNLFQWQPGFYDTILQNEKAIEMIREYICNNPLNWIEDDLYNF